MTNDMDGLIHGGAALSGPTWARDLLRELDTKWFSLITVQAIPGLLGPPPMISLWARKILSDGYQMESRQHILAFKKSHLKKGFQKALLDAKTDLIEQGAPDV